MDPDFSYEASLFLIAPKLSIAKRAEGVSPWVEMINDLMFGAGYSYSRIAYRIHAAPSTIQKLATNSKRKPRPKILQPLVELHYKVFQGQYVTPRAREYWQKKISLSKR